MKALIKSQEPAPLNQLFYLLSFHFPFSVIQIKSRDFIRACPWWVTTCFAAGGSRSLHKAVFKPDLHSGTMGQILVPLKLTGPVVFK